MKWKWPLRTLPFSIERAAFMIAAFTLLSRIFGALRDQLLTTQLGLGTELDIYTTAFRLPDTIYNLLILGTLSVTFVPVFTSYYLEDKKRAQHIANSILTIVTSGILIVCAIIFIFAEWFTHLIAPGFKDETFRMTVNLTRLMLLSPILFTVSSIFNSYLTSLKKFFVISFAPILYNIGIITGFFLFYPRWGVMGLGYGVIFGAIMYLIVDFIEAYRHGYRVRLIYDFWDEGVRKIGALFLPRMFALDISFVSLIIASVIGSLLPAGSIAAYTTAYNLESVAVGIFALSFVMALFPVLSSLHAQQEEQKFLVTLRDYTIRILYFTVPVTIGTLLFRAHIVRLWFGHGKVGWDDTILLINILGVLAFAMVSQSLVPLFARAFYARKNTVTPFLVGLVGVAVNAIVSYEGAQHYGAAGIALGFTSASITNCLLLFMALRLHLGKYLEGLESTFDLPLLKSAVKIILAALLAGIVSYSLLFLVGPYFNTRTTLGIFLQATVAFAGGGIVYLTFTHLMGFRETRAFRRFLLK